MSFLVSVEMRARPGAEKELEELMGELAVIGRQEPGCRQYRFCRDVTDGSHLLFEQWDSREAHDAHFFGPAQQRLPKLMPLLAEPLRIQYHSDANSENIDIGA